jgi:potassium/chloride transporter 4/5/6
VINIVAAMENLSGDPSWRPKIRVPWAINLLGGLGCVVVMFLINSTAGIVAILVEALIWALLSRRESKAAWGDARRGMYETIIRMALIKLSRRPMSPRNWRPHILVFVSDPVKHLDLIRFGNWFSQGRGVVTCCQLVIGDLLDQDPKLDEKQEIMQKLLDSEGLVVFAEANVVNEVVEGIVNVTQANGMAGIESNTVLLGWPKDTGRLAEFLRVMRQLERLNKSLIIGHIQPRYLFQREGVEPVIHVWWGGLQRNGDLMLLLAYLLTRDPIWKKAKIQIMSIASNELMKARTENYLARLMPEIRIEAEPRVFIKPKDKSINEMIQELSAQAEVVFFGLAIPEPGKEEEYATRLEEMAENFSTIFFVKNSSLFIGELLTPEEEQKPTEPAAPVPKTPAASEQS